MIAVRVVSERGRLRLRNPADQKNVQCPREWRETLRVGVALEIDARLRADGECWVYYPPQEAQQ